MEGKEVRFGVGGSVLTAVVTSNGATGSYNAMHDSFRPIGVLVPLVNMLLGEVIFGGLGTGLYSMVMVALVGVFIAGLMIGRTPEYLGKTIKTTEAKLIAGYTVLTPLVVTLLTAWAVAVGAGKAGLVTNGGSRGFTEVLFAYASCMANNGQTMAGLNANSPFYNLTTMVAMAAGRFGLAALALALAGRFAAQTNKPETIGSMPCDTLTFGVLVLGSVILVGALSFFPCSPLDRSPSICTPESTRVRITVPAVNKHHVAHAADSNSKSIFVDLSETVHTILMMLRGLDISPRFPCSESRHHSRSEHDLFIRLFLTGGGGW